MGPRWGMEMEMMATQATAMKIRLTMNCAHSHQPSEPDNPKPKLPEPQNLKKLSISPNHLPQRQKPGKEFG